MIGTKFFKGAVDWSAYKTAAEWCNDTQKARIEDCGDCYEVVAMPKPTLAELKKQEKAELSFQTSCIPAGKLL